MSVRKRALPQGWYPSGAERTRSAIEAMAKGFTPVHDASGIAGVVPHAGWEFSGSLVLEVMTTFSRLVDTIVIIGGHLGPADGILCASEDFYETPLGLMPADLDLRDVLASRVSMSEDLYADNSVEVLLPFARYLFPDARALGLRCAPTREAVALGKAIADAGRQLKRRIAVLGSTDLTHYGPNYGFCPAGSGESGVSWVQEVNDRRLVEALLAMKPEKVLDLATTEKSACSAGGAVSALSFAHELGVVRGALVRYATSLDVHRADSFVGYAGVLYRL